MHISGTIWATAVGASLIYARKRVPIFKPSVRLIHATMQDFLTCLQTNVRIRSKKSMDPWVNRQYAGMSCNRYASQHPLKPQPSSITSLFLLFFSYLSSHSGDFFNLCFFLHPLEADDVELQWCSRWEGSGHSKATQT
ncbi:hypothetical protein ZOSMA_132G00660 [Zostera marina]|uniref:Uncharacterized protein n=1 Tax=Zostera marina TaxID=29655 RepID=A0A0K9PZ59_ZOSMR|nr:hypothetical protein ZOSMA_132G00660 [Zostera marina]